MSAIDRLFQRLREEGRKAFMPFITAGDPDLAFTAEAIAMFERQGCHLCELGFPYSDPIADGPVIQASYTRALECGVTVAQILEMLKPTARQRQMPVVAMASYAILHRWGPEKWIDHAQQCGIAGAIVPDLLAEEDDSLHELCRQRDFSLIHLVAPTTPRPRALRIAQRSTGFLYYVSVTGITGARNVLPASVVENVSWLKEHTELPVCIGFGISRPEHVRMLAPVADGVIVGSALVRRLDQAASKSRSQVLADMQTLVDQLLGAMPAAGRPAD